MSLVVEGQTYEWDGGTLEELLGLLAEAALSVRVEALHPDREDKLGEIHVVAGGVSETIAGDRRGDEAMAHLRQIPGLRFLAHAQLPNPDDGSLVPPGPLEGALVDRPPPVLMRYCEDYVLTCALELRHGPDHVRISYRRGEILRTLVNGSESGERLPEVMGWTEGAWRLSLPQLALPRPPKPARALRGPAVDSGTIFGYQVQPLHPTASPLEPANNRPDSDLSAALLEAPPPATAPLRGLGEAASANFASGQRMGPVALARVSDPPAPGTPRAPAPPPALDSAATGSLPARRQSRGSWFGSLLFHALLGVALGLAIVGGYWAFLRWGSALRMG